MTHPTPEKPINLAKLPLPGHPPPGLVHFHYPALHVVATRLAPMASATGTGMKRKHYGVIYNNTEASGDISLFDDARDLLGAEALTSVIVNSGGTSLGAHTDKPELGKLIVGVNLYGFATLTFKPVACQGPSYELKLRPGDCYLMSNESRRDYTHALRTEPQRVSITLRSNSFPALTDALKTKAKVTKLRMINKGESHASYYMRIGLSSSNPLLARMSVPPNCKADAAIRTSSDVNESDEPSLTRPMADREPLPPFAEKSKISALALRTPPQITSQQAPSPAGQISSASQAAMNVIYNDIVANECHVKIDTVGALDVDGAALLGVSYSGQRYSTITKSANGFAREDALPFNVGEEVKVDYYCCETFGDPGSSGQNCIYYAVFGITRYIPIMAVKKEGLPKKFLSLSQVLDKATLHLLFNEPDYATYRSKMYDYLASKNVNPWAYIAPRERAVAKGERPASAAEPVARIEGIPAKELEISEKIKFSLTPLSNTTDATISPRGRGRGRGRGASQSNGSESDTSVGSNGSQRSVSSGRGRASPIRKNS